MFDNIHPVGLTSRACREVLHIMSAKNIPAGYGLRVGVRGGGGCGGASLMIGFDTRKESDIAYQVEGIDVFVDKRHTLYLIGKKVDFIDEADGRGFTFVDDSVPEAHP